MAGYWMLAVDPLNGLQCWDPVVPGASHGCLIGLGFGEFGGKANGLGSLLCSFSNFLQSGRFWKAADLGCDFTLEYVFGQAGGAC